MIVDEGMSEVSCRVLSNTKITTGLTFDVHTTSKSLYENSPISSESEHNALQNIEHCVVGLFERWNETKSVINHWFPWINTHNWNHDYKRAKREELRDDLKYVLLQANQCDNKLYAKMTYLFDAQISFLNR